MKNTLSIGIAIILLILLGACSSADVSGDENLRKYGDTTFKNSGGGTQTINVTINASSETLTDTDQTTDNDPRNETAPKLAVGWEGATAAAGKENLIDGAVNTATRLLDNSKKESGVPAERKTEPTLVKEQVDTGGGYETRFHHTTTGSSDGGKSLVLCPGQVMNFEKCSVGDVIIPHHGMDTGRVIYWNMTEVPQGDINCIKDGKTYKYKADSTIVHGDC